MCLRRDLATVKPLCPQVEDIAWECLRGHKVLGLFWVGNSALSENYAKCLIFWRAGQNKTANTYVIDIAI